MFFSNGMSQAGFGMLMLSSMLVLLFVLWRDQVVLVTRLLAVAGKALVANTSLVGAAVLMQLMLGVVAVPLLVSGRHLGLHVVHAACSVNVNWRFGLWINAEFMEMIKWALTWWNKCC